MNEEKKKKSVAHSHSHDRKKKNRFIKNKTRSRISKQKTCSRVRAKDRETLATLLSQNSVDDVVQCFPFSLAFCPCRREDSEKNIKFKKISSKRRNSTKLQITVEREIQEEEKDKIDNPKDTNKEGLDLENVNDKQVPVTLDNIKANYNIRNLMSNLKLTSLFTRSSVPKTLSQVKLLLASNPNLKDQIKLLLGDSLNYPNMKAISELLEGNENEESAVNDSVLVNDCKPSLKPDDSGENEKSLDANNKDVSKTCTNLKRSSSIKREIEEESANSQASLFSKIVSAIFGTKEVKEEKIGRRKSIRKTKLDYSVTDEKTKKNREMFEKRCKNSSLNTKERFQWQDIVRVTKNLKNINKESFCQEDKRAKSLLKQFLTDYSRENISKPNETCENNDPVLNSYDIYEVKPIEGEIIVGGKSTGDTTMVDLKDTTCSQFPERSFDEFRSIMKSKEEVLESGLPKSMNSPDISKNILHTETQILHKNDDKSKSRVSFSESILYNPDNPDNKNDRTSSRDNISDLKYKSQLGTNHQPFTIKRIKSEEMLNSSSGDVIYRLNSLMKELISIEGETIESPKPKLISRDPLSKTISKDINNTNKFNSVLRLSTSQNTFDGSLCQMMCASFVEKLAMHESREEAKNASAIKSHCSTIPWGKNEFQIYNLPSVQTLSPFMSSSNSLLGEISNVESNSIESSNGVKTQLYEENIDIDRGDSIVSTSSVKESIKGALNNHCEPTKDWIRKKVSFNDRPSWVSYSIASEESNNITALRNNVDIDEIQEKDSSQNINDGVLNQLNTLLKQIHNKTDAPYMKEIHKDPLSGPEPVTDSLEKNSSLCEMSLSSIANDKSIVEPTYSVNFQVYCAPLIQTDNPFLEESVTNNINLEAINEENSVISLESIKSGLDVEGSLSSFENNNQRSLESDNQGIEADRNLANLNEQEPSTAFHENGQLLKDSDSSENVVESKGFCPKEENISIEEMFDLEKCSKSKPLGKFLLEQHIRNVLRVPSGEETVATVPSASNTDFTNITSTISSLEDNVIEDIYSETQRGELRKILQFLIRTVYHHQNLFNGLSEFESETKLIKCPKKNCIGIQCKLSQENQHSVENNLKPFLNFRRKFESEIVTKTKSNIESLCSENDPFTRTSDSGFHSKSLVSLERRQFISLPDLLVPSVPSSNNSTPSFRNERWESSSLNFEVSSPSSLSCQASGKTVTSAEKIEVSDSQTSNSAICQETFKQTEIANNLDSTSSSVENSSLETSSKSKLRRILKKIRIKDRNK